MTGMNLGPWLLQRTALLLAIGALSLPAWAGSSASAVLPSVCGTPDNVLPPKAILPLGVVHRFFPRVTQEVSAGANPTAAGNPIATRSVVYATADGARKVTISVDLYRDANDASSAYQEAVEKSRGVTGFNPLTIPKVGEQSFAGTVSRNETHIGIGTLDDALIIGATLAGYDAMPRNIRPLIVLSRRELVTAKQAISRTSHC